MSLKIRPSTGDLFTFIQELREAMAKEDKNKHKPKFKAVPLSAVYAYRSSTSPNIEKEKEWLKEINEAIHSNTMDNELAKKYFGDTAEIIDDYTIDEKYLRNHRYNPKVKLLKYDNNILNTAGKLFIPAFRDASIFCVNKDYLWESNESDKSEVKK